MLREPFTSEANMKGLTVRQPWASLIAMGYKTIEARTWTTDYRGPLLIISSKTGLAEFEGFKLPRGYALATCNLVDVHRFTEDDLEPAYMEKMPSKPHYAWVLEDITELEPVTMTGKLKLFDVPEMELTALDAKHGDHLYFFNGREPEED